MSGRSGLKHTITADGTAHEVKAVNADGTTGKPLELQASELEISTGIAGENSLWISPNVDTSELVLSVYDSDNSTKSDIGLFARQVRTRATTTVIANGAGAFPLTMTPAAIFAVTSAEDMAISCASGSANLSLASGTFNGNIFVRGYSSIGLKAPSISVRTIAETFGYDETIAAAYTKIYAATLTSHSDTIAQHGSAAGITRTQRGQKGYGGGGGFIGGDFVVGAGDGGITGTNSPGAYRIKTGTPVTSTGGKVALEHEDGTRYLEILQVPGPTTEFHAGPFGGVTRGLRFVGTSVEMAASGLVHCNATTDLYFSTGMGGSAFYREVGTVVRTDKNDADGASYLDWIAGVTSIELRHAGAAKFKYDATLTRTIVAGSYIEIGTVGVCSIQLQAAANAIYRDSALHVLRDTAENFFHGVVPTSLTVPSTSTANCGTYTVAAGVGVRVKTTFSFFNTSDSEIANFVREAAFKNLAGVMTQTGTTVPEGTDFYDAAQTGVAVDIDFSGVTVRNRVTNPNADTLKCRTHMEIFEVAA